MATSRAHIGRPAGIDLLVMPGAHLLDVAAPAQILGHPSLNLPLTWMSPEPEVHSAQGLTFGRLQALPDVIGPGRWLIITGSRQAERHLEDAPFVAARHWLRRCAERYAYRAAICSGALLAGTSGLLDERPCTTHHELVETLRLLAPRAQVQEDCLFTEAHDCITSAGIATGLDMSLHLVARSWGHAMAATIARETVLYHRRSGNDSQSSFWLQHRNHLCERVHHVQELIMGAPGTPWTVALLADRIHVSERHLRRLFSETTGLPLGEYLMQARMTLARQFLTDTRLSLVEIAERCGIGSDRSLRRQFQDLHGTSPSSFRQQNRMS